MDNQNSLMVERQQIDRWRGEQGVSSGTAGELEPLPFHRCTEGDVCFECEIFTSWILCKESGRAP